MENETKICSKCESEKDVKKFNADRRRKDGKRASCKDCDAAHKKRIRDENIDEYRKRNREANKAFRERKRWAEAENDEDA